jgi:DNA-binding NtrC family response regulator
MPRRNEGIVMAKEKVLLVDDNPEFTEVLSQRMEARDVAVDIAASGAEALEKVSDESYDAIVLDLAMPGMDGMETLKRLLEKRPDLQVILLTGHASLAKGVEAIKIGAMDFLEKPAEIQALMEKIKEAKAKKMLLVEKGIEERLKGILGSKSW